MAVAAMAPALSRPRLTAALRTRRGKKAAAALGLDFDDGRCGTTVCVNSIVNPGDAVGGEGAASTFAASASASSGHLPGTPTRLVASAACLSTRPSQAQLRLRQR